MGYSRFSEDVYAARRAHRGATGASAFGYTDDVMAHVGRAGWRVADRLNPRGVSYRESRDSAAHPQSTAVAVLFDVTGSMGAVPRELQAKLPQLFGVLMRKAYITDPQILFGAIGDATCDAAPLQIGQFESGNETEDDLSALLLEGGGGGQTMESYELAMYFMARHTACDCVEKRARKGYLFIIGDEKPYDRVKGREVQAVIGDTLQADIPTADMVAELRRTWHVFYIIPKAGSYWRDPQVLEPWRALLGQYVVEVEDHSAVCETIAMLIGLSEGVDLEEGVTDLMDAGADRHAVTVARSAVRDYACTALAPAPVVLPAAPPPTRGVIRL